MREAQDGRKGLRRLIGLAKRFDDGGQGSKISARKPPITKLDRRKVRIRMMGEPESRIHGRIESGLSPKDVCCYCHGSDLALIHHPTPRGRRVKRNPLPPGARVCPHATHTPRAREKRLTAPDTPGMLPRMARELRGRPAHARWWTCARCAHRWCSILGHRPRFCAACKRPSWWKPARWRYRKDNGRIAKGEHSETISKNSPKKC